MSRGTRLLLQALAILVFISSTFTVITLEQLQDSFHLEMNPEFGGSCNRVYENETMLPKVLQAFGDAWLLSSDGIQSPMDQIEARSESEASVQAFTRLRGLLFIFFGIRLNSDGQFNDDESHRAYNNLLSEFSGVDALQTEPADPFGYGLPKFRCLEDYSDFYVHMADAEGVEDPNQPLAAEYFDQRYPGENGGFLPGLWHYNLYGTYYRGPVSDPTGRFCDQDDNIMFTTPISGPASPLYGITACERFFRLPNLNDDGPAETSQDFIATSGAVLLNEMLIMESRIGLRFQPWVVPDNGNWSSDDWSQWNFPDPLEGDAVSMKDCIELGLAKPRYARKNAPSYVHFALCLYFDELDCT